MLTQGKHQRNQGRKGEWPRKVCEDRYAALTTFYKIHSKREQILTTFILPVFALLCMCLIEECKESLIDTVLKERKKEGRFRNSKI